MNNPISIGGVGGSGTRLIAEMAINLGFKMGEDLNKANDNLLFTLLFKDPKFIKASSDEIYLKYKILKRSICNLPLSLEERKHINLCVNSRPQHTIEWLETRRDNACNETCHNRPINNWGWKEPNTHVYINQLLTHDKELKYIHVVRNGLDMAFSANQNQFKIWCEHFLNEKQAYSPENSFKYWIAVHERILELKGHFPERIHILNYDRLINHDKNECEALFHFFNVEENAWKEVMKLVLKPKSVGRYLNKEKIAISSADKTIMQKLGFPV